MLDAGWFLFVIIIVAFNYQPARSPLPTNNLDGSRLIRYF